MNVDRLRALADHIEGLPHRTSEEEDAQLYQRLIAFDMRCWGICGSAGCIAGHAEQLWPDVESDDPARTALGLEDDEADDLFVPYVVIVLRSITPAMAARVLRRVADGEPARSAWDAELGR